MKKKTIVVAALAGAVLLSAAGGGGWWWYTHRIKPNQAVKVEEDKTEYKYVRLDKVFVMLRSAEGGNFATPLAIDLVFKVPAKSAGHMKEELPLLQAIAHRTLAEMTRPQMTALTSEQVAAILDKAFKAAYEAEHRERPFVSVLIGKLIVE